MIFSVIKYFTPNQTEPKQFVADQWHTTLGQVLANNRSYSLEIIRSFAK